MDKYLDDLRPFGEEGLDRELKNEILLSGLQEARRYSRKRIVSPGAVSADVTHAQICFSDTLCALFLVYFTKDKLISSTDYRHASIEHSGSCLDFRDSSNHLRR